MKKNKRPTYISLFSSAGIGCHGFKLNKFDCIATCELIDRRMQIQKFNDVCTYKTGYITGDIVLQETKDAIFKEIHKWEDKKNIKEVDVVIATPPCQGMSVANHKKKNERLRNSLVVESIKLVNKIKPKFFVFENVRAFLNTLCTDIDGVERSIKDSININLAGEYNILFKVINFKEYGVPSSRTRTLVLGVRKNIKDFTPYDIFPDKEDEITLKEAIGNLDKLDVMGTVSKKDIYHNFRPYNPMMLEWIKDLKEGQSAFQNTDKKKIPHRIVNGKIVYNVNKNGDKYSRCYWNKVAPCIHTRNDVLSSQATVHPKDNRVFSIRELMKMMSIPYSFNWSEIKFKELNSLNADEKRIFLKKNEMNIRQSIGEAVPTHIFEQIASKIKFFLDNGKLTDKEITKLIQEQNLDSYNKLIKFLKKNNENYSFTELSKISELSNSKRTNNAAYYTSQDICYTLIKDLPIFNQKKELRILEPSVDYTCQGWPWG